MRQADSVNAPEVVQGRRSEQTRFRPDIEGLRAVAVLAVVLFHAEVPGVDGGFVGVDVFFVISGFLITGLLWREATGTGTRLTLWAAIDRNFIAMGAAGWHLCLDVLNHLLAGTPVGRIVGADALKFGGWQRLHQEYAQQFDNEAPEGP